MHRICLKIIYNLKDSSKKKLFIMKFIENILELFSGVFFSIYTFLVGRGCAEANLQAKMIIPM